jgi:hypothetical protein
MKQHLSESAAAPLSGAEIARLGSIEHPRRNGHEPTGDCIMPVPSGVGLPGTKLQGRDPDRRFSYKNADGQLLGYVLRWDARDEVDKEFRPATFWRNEVGKGIWRNRIWPGARPLFGLDRLAARPAAIVLLAEGEKAADAIEDGPLADAFKWAQRQVIGMTWPGGTKAIGHADFSPLVGREVIILQDNDEPGEHAGDALVEALKPLGVRSLRRWRPPAEARPKWDIADPVPDGVDPVMVVKAILEAPEVAIEAPFTGFVATGYRWPDPASIPQRKFLFGRHYARKAIGATIAAGGRAKTTLGLLESVGMACGRDLLAGCPTPPLRVWCINGEEDQDELDRRVAAICQHYEISKADCGERLFVQSVRDRPMRLGTMAKNTPTLNTEVLAQLEAEIRVKQVDVFMLDPWVSFHSLLENDNGHQDLLLKEGLGAVASRTGSAGEIYHHPGKPKMGQPETTVEDARGASSIIAAVRSARVLNFMTTDQAGKLGIGEDARRLHIQIANGKANMGPLGKAVWFKLQVENLPNGDEVVCSTSWKPPNPFQDVTAEDMQRCRNVVQGGAYRQSVQSSEWVGYVVADVLGIDVAHGADNDPKDVARLKEIIRVWFKNKVLATEKRKDKNRIERDFVIPGAWRPEPQIADAPPLDPDEPEFR